MCISHNNDEVSEFGLAYRIICEGKNDAMKSIQLLSEVPSSEKRPEADPIYVDRNGRILRFELEPHQSIKRHNAPDSPFYAVVLKGRGMFSGAEGKEEAFGPNSLIIFEPGEDHAIRTLDEKLVFVGFLHGAPSNVTEKVGGAIGHHAN